MARDDYYGWDDQPRRSGGAQGGPQGRPAGRGDHVGGAGYGGAEVGAGGGARPAAGAGVYPGGPRGSVRTVALSVVATLAVVALVAGGIWWLTSRDSGGAGDSDDTQAAAVTSTTTPSPTSAGATTVTEQPSSSAPMPETTTVYATPLDADSDSGTGPGHTISSVQLDGGGRVTISTLPCDGRNVLISTSVTDDTPDPQGQIAQALLDAPGQAQYLVPGSCPSIRGSVNGASVYPIVTDYGRNADALCAAAATYGGDPRILSDRAEYTSPC